MRPRRRLRLEARTLNDIRALGGNDAADDARFATVARVSEINLGLYQTVAAPVVRGMVTEQAAEALRAAHPNRLRFAAFSDRNPMMQPVKALAESVRAARQAGQCRQSTAGDGARGSVLDHLLPEAYGEFRDRMTETVFLNTYGSPLLQAMVGLGVQQATPQSRRARPGARGARGAVARGTRAPLRSGRAGGGRAARAGLHPSGGRQHRRAWLSPC